MLPSAEIRFGAHPVGELHVARGARGVGLRHAEQVLRGLPGGEVRAARSCTRYTGTSSLRVFLGSFTENLEVLLRKWSGKKLVVNFKICLNRLQ